MAQRELEHELEKARLIIEQQHKEIKYLKEIIETAVQYAVDFDLLVPPYDQVKIATVEQMQVEIQHSKIQTGKRLGFKFNSASAVGRAQRRSAPV